MAVERAFRVTRGSARVAQPHRHPLIGAAPRKPLVTFVEQVLVVPHVRQRGLDVSRRVHQHVVLDAANLVRHPLVQRQRRGVDEDHAVFGVIDDVGELRGKEPDVERVTHGPATGNAEVHLKMLVVIPGERADAVTRFDPETGQRRGQLPAASMQIGIGVRVHRAIGLPGVDQLVVEQPARMLDDAVERERVFHHQAVHRRFLGASTRTGRPATPTWGGGRPRRSPAV